MSTPEEDIQRVAAFHGHICPGLAYGVRVARAALRELGPRALDEELVAVVENDSCSVDAIQVLAGCTSGKGNLIFRDTGKSVYTFFRRGGEGEDARARAVRIAVDFDTVESDEDRATWARFRAGERDPVTVERVAELKAAKVGRILHASEADVLKVEGFSGSPPRKARVFPSLRCGACGEKVMEPRARLRDGQIVCIPCFERS